MSAHPNDAMFHDEKKAREYFESLRWPDGQPVCAHCGSTNVHRLGSRSRRPGQIMCNDCLALFTVTVGTVMQSTHVPLTKWALAFHKMAASKSGMSAKQLQRELNVGSYRTARFMFYRIRDALKWTTTLMSGPIAGLGKKFERDGASQPSEQKINPRGA
jgi:transposase-like protein